MHSDQFPRSRVLGKEAGALIDLKQQRRVSLRAEIVRVMPVPLPVPLPLAPALTETLYENT